MTVPSQAIYSTERRFTPSISNYWKQTSSTATSSPPSFSSWVFFSFFFLKTVLQSALNLDRAHVRAAACKHGSSGSRGWERERGWRRKGNARTVCVCMCKGRGQAVTAASVLRSQPLQHKRQRSCGILSGQNSLSSTEHSVNAATETDEPRKRFGAWACFNIKDSLVNYCNSAIKLQPWWWRIWPRAWSVFMYKSSAIKARSHFKQVWWMSSVNLEWQSLTHRHTHTCGVTVVLWVKN